MIHREQGESVESFLARLDAEQERLRKAEEERMRECAVIWENQRKGMEHEKAGNTEAAIACYLEAVNYGEASPYAIIQNYAHSYERLAVCYRKLKLYGNEVDVLERLVAHSDLYAPYLDKYRERLTKARQLHEKQTKNA